MLILKGMSVNDPSMLRSLLLLMAVVTLTAPVSACREPEPETVDRQVFIEAYARVRERALTSPDATISPADREAILSELGVTEADLEAFVEAHATDVTFMRDVWADVEARLDVNDLNEPAPDTVG